MSDVTLTPWADWSAKMAFADQLVKTGFLPSAIKTPAQALAIIFAGQEIGIPPMHALRSIDIIQGRPRLSAELQLALFKQRGGRAVWKQSDERIAELWLRHPNGDEHTETFTIDDAKRAGLMGKDNWRTYPKNMLRARCTSAALRAVAPDITAGIYDPDEIPIDVTPNWDMVGPVVVPAAAVTKLEALTATLKAAGPPPPATADDPGLDVREIRKPTLTETLKKARLATDSANPPPSEADYQASLLATDGADQTTKVPHPDR